LVLTGTYTRPFPPNAGLNQRRLLVSLRLSVRQTLKTIKKMKLSGRSVLSSIKFGNSASHDARGAARACSEFRNIPFNPIFTHAFYAESQLLIDFYSTFT